jgi:hypothetical protein
MLPSWLRGFSSVILDALLPWPSLCLDDRPGYAREQIRKIARINSLADAQNRSNYRGKDLMGACGIQSRWGLRGERVFTAVVLVLAGHQLFGVSWHRAP